MFIIYRYVDSRFIQKEREREIENTRENEKTEGFVLGAQSLKEKGKKTLILDLDETLVHSCFQPVENAHIILPVEIEGKVCNVYVLIRPGVQEFLKKMSPHYEIVVYTASLSKVQTL